MNVQDLRLAFLKNRGTTLDDAIRELESAFHEPGLTDRRRCLLAVVRDEVRSLWRYRMYWRIPPSNAGRIAKLLGVRPARVEKWINHFLSGGLNQLFHTTIVTASMSDPQVLDALSKVIDLNPAQNTGPEPWKAAPPAIASERFPAAGELGAPAIRPGVAPSEGTSAPHDSGIVGEAPIKNRPSKISFPVDEKTGLALVMKALARDDLTALTHTCLTAVRDLFVYKAGARSAGNGVKSIALRVGVAQNTIRSWGGILCDRGVDAMTRVAVRTLHKSVLKKGALKAAGGLGALPATVDHAPPAGTSAHPDFEAGADESFGGLSPDYHDIGEDWTGFGTWSPSGGLDALVDSILDDHQGGEGLFAYMPEVLRTSGHSEAESFRMGQMQRLIDASSSIPTPGGSAMAHALQPTVADGVAATLLTAERGAGFHRAQPVLHSEGRLFVPRAAVHGASLIGFPMR